MKFRISYFFFYLHSLQSFYYNNNLNDFPDFRATLIFSTKHLFIFSTNNNNNNSNNKLLSYVARYVKSEWKQPGTFALLLVVREKIMGGSFRKSKPR